MSRLDEIRSGQLVIVVVLLVFVVGMTMFFVGDSMGFERGFEDGVIQTLAFYGYNSAYYENTTYLPIDEDYSGDLDASLILDEGRIRMGVLYNESICQCTNINGSAFSSIQVCINRVTDNDTEWELMRESYYEDKFIQEVAVYPC